MNIVIVHNPKSGTSHSLVSLRQKCKKYNIIIIDAIAISDSLEQDLAPHIKAGAMIAVIGGDGTMSSIAGMIEGTNAVMIPIAGGTLNHFTKDLGISQQIDDVLKNIKTATVTKIDTGSVNEKTFVNNASFGIYPVSLTIRKEYERAVGKWPAAFLGAVMAFVRFRLYDVTIDGVAMTTPFVFVGNNVYDLTDTGIVTRNHLDQGVLSVMVVRTQSRFHILRIILRLVIGNAHRLKEFEVYTTTDITVQTKRRSMLVSHDGEVTRLISPLVFSIRKKSLRILK